MNNNAKIKFSIVIPTRERGEMLDAAIRTCITQDYANFEIIVSNNFSQDNTAEVVKAIKDERLVYVNTGQRLSMADNWEFGLSQVTGNFVLFLGDDDALLPGALKELSGMITRLGCEIITWDGASYYWPGCIIERAPNMLVIPLEDKLEKRNGNFMLQEVLAFKKTFHELPNIYRGVVSRRLIDHIKERSGGRFFHSMCPDIYSAIVLSGTTDSYYYSTKPYSIFGQSQHSTGAAYFYSQKESEAGAGDKFLNEPNIPCHDCIVLAPANAFILVNTFMQAKENYTALPKYEIDLKESIRQALKEVAHASRDKYDRVVSAVQEIAGKNALEDFAEPLLRQASNQPWENVGIDVAGYNIFRKRFVLDCAQYGVSDVYQASLLCKLVLEHKIAGMSFSWFPLIKTTVQLLRNLFKRRYGRHKSEA